MPELPEMETYRKLLSDKIRGKVITSVIVNREKSINVAQEAFEKELIQASVVGVHRRAKHLIIKLSSGKSLLLHLMLGGWMYLGNENDNPDRTKQVIISFGDLDLYFIGLRLGYLHLLTEENLQKELADLGPEPLNGNLSLAEFLTLIGKKKGMLKTTLVNQQFIAGIGNCYSDEICYGARLMPTKKADSLNEQTTLELFNAIQAVLNRAIGLGGYMENPLFKGDKLTGGYNQHCFVYDREGEPCHECGGEIVKEEISSRKTFYCPNCQRY